ncbi:MAG: hypothetical protein IPL46_29930 [Saprospiraceae bacterium]|nr:hypothetical protein [Saprospiraceae bacterium]
MLGTTMEEHIHNDILETVKQDKQYVPQLADIRGDGLKAKNSIPNCDAQFEKLSSWKR